MNITRRFACLSLMVTFLFLLLSACGSSSDSTIEGHFAGKVSDTDAFIAVVSDGDTIVGYVCDGQTIAEWFGGNIAGNDIELTSEGGAHLKVALGEKNAIGTVTFTDGSSHSFSADVVTEPAGLYREESTVDGVEFVTGWIILSNGESRGLGCGLGFGGFGGCSQPSCFPGFGGFGGFNTCGFRLCGFNVFCFR